MQLLRWLYLIGLLRSCNSFSLSIGGVAALATLLASPALGDETCTVDASSGDEVCASQTQDAPKAGGASHAIVEEADSDDDDSDDDDDSEDYDSDDDDEYIEDEDGDEEEEERNANDSDGTGHPIWWNYSIDELFEDLWDCGEVVYGYETYTDDEQVGEEAKDARKLEEVKGSDKVSVAQIRYLEQQWAAMREKYVKEVHLVPIELHMNEEGSSTQAGTGNGDGKSKDTTTVSSSGRSSLVVPNRIGDAGPHKGRGVYATEPIPAGTLVSDLDNGSTGIFKTGHSWREFVATLPRVTACNFIEWSWVQTIPPAHENDDDIRNGLTIFIAFDESNLLNSADWDGIEANVRCGTPPEKEGGERGPCRFQYYAARDIAAGEELLIDYGEFEDLSQEGWTDIGL